MYDRFLCFFLIAVVSGPAVLAQRDCTKRIAGQVLSETGAPLPGAEIMVRNLQLGVVADDKGFFVLEKLCDDRYTIEVRYLGYRTLRAEIPVNAPKAQILNMEVETKKLEEIVVEEKPQYVEQTQNFSSVNEKQLSELAGKTLGESLKEIPGVNTIQAGPGIFKPVIHGVHSQRILILNHGIRQEGQQWGAEHAPEIDPFIASNVVVIKDASAIKYGTDALGGVIVVNPPPLPQTPGLGGSVVTVFQSNGRSGTISGMLEGGIKKLEGWGWRLQGTAKRAGDFHAADYSLTNTGIKELDFSVAAGFHKDDIGAEIFFSHFQTELGILRGAAIGNLDDLVTAMEREPPQGTTNFSYAIGEPRQEVSHNLVKLNSHWKRKSGEWRLQYGFQANSRKEFDLRIGGLSKTPALDLQLGTHTLELEWEVSDAAGRTFCFGFNGMAQDNRNVPGTQRIPFIPNYTSISGGPFAVAKVEFKRWVADFGVRYDFRNYAVAGRDFKNTLYNADLNFHNVSASAGFAHSLNQHHTIKLNLSSAWRPPHVAELYSLGTHQSAAAIEYGLLLNPSSNEVMNIKDVPFKLEQALKAVATHQFTGNRFQLETTIYANFIFNYIYLRPVGITQNVRGTYPYFRYTQTDALFVGVDLSGDWQATDRIKVNAKASILRASDHRNHDYLVFIPSNRFELGLRYETGKQHFYVEPRIKYVARQIRAPRVVTVREIKESAEAGQDPFAGNSSNFDFMAAPDGYGLVSIATGVSLSTKYGRYEFRLAVENALNASYREYTNRFRYYADDLGRNFMISAKYIF